ncbi:MAG: hypothetical protein CL477_15080 [Acidobacteria bacterium]|nr:hypothetical protein [Acidobacteriota bacterium]|tara:strand:+ start:24 stop:518 length:495 start_codon:yes stop_codon:yes gene_type:complete
MSQVMLQPVLFGGLFMGVLSALPIISIGNCCCLWVIGGGMVTAYLTQHGKPDPIQLGDGALGGFLSGVVGAVVYAVVALPIQLLTAPLQRGLMDGLLESAADVPPEVREMLEGLGAGGGLGAVAIGFFFMLAIGMVFSTLGGLFGALIFRSTPPAAPAAPIIPA